MFKKYLNIKIRKSDFFLNLGTNFFNIGIFLLPSAFFFSSFFLFISLIISNIKNRDFLKDSWNIPLIICSFLMIIICLIPNFNPTNFYNLSINKNLNWLGLANWIPMFWLYFCAQFYLKDNKARRLCALLLMLGTIPILISGFGQYYFEWHGPFQLLKGTIIWYQRGNDEGFQTLTGPFNNANVAGTWLTTIFPFSIFYIINSSKRISKRIFYILLTLATLLATLLTHSRNALINTSIASLLMLGVSLKILFICTIVIFLLCASIFIFEIPLDFLNLFKKSGFLSSFIPETSKLSDFLNFYRIKIWRTTIFNIFKSPFIGWGASSFSTLYLLKYGNDYSKSGFQHTHNLVLELANNYGIFVSLILFTTIFFLIYKSKPNISSNRLNENLIDKFWWISTLIILLMHMSDIAYYDGRISILFWILMAGIRCILRESSLKNSIKKGS